MKTLRRVIVFSKGVSVHYLGPKDHERLQQIVNTFHFASNGIGSTTLTIHTINTGDAKPIKQRYYPLVPLTVHAENDRSRVGMNDFYECDRRKFEFMDFRGSDRNEVER